MTEDAKKIIESHPAAKKRKYKLKQTAFENITLANEIRATFVDANAYFSANETSLLSCNSAEIIKGVDETIKIKIEALKEATDLFSTESEQTVTMFEPASVLLTNDEVLIKSYADEIAFSLCPYSSGQEADSITNRTFNEVFGLFMQDKAVQAEKYAEKFAEKLRKQTIKFKKEQLLYEISAFEEIMCYSISRVKQDPSEAAVGYAAAAERCFSDISLCLLKSGIEIIRPNSGDRFNGKEHEVLMAEKNPDFAKGEIIKTMNSGYKQGDITLIRANVIAAR
jgi:molecular chaperone GrpE (heat shock protein)